LDKTFSLYKSYPNQKIVIFDTFEPIGMIFNLDVMHVHFYPQEFSILTNKIKK